MADRGTGVSCGAFVKVQENFAADAEVEAAGEALGREGVIEQGAKLAIEGKREQEGEREIKGVGPEEGGKTAERDGQAVEKDVAALGHALTLSASAAIT